VKDGSVALGAPEVAGSFVNPKGLSNKFSNAPVVPATGLPAGAPELPRFGRVGYLSVTDEEIAILRTRRAAFSTKITDEVLARAPRSAIAGVEFDAGMLSHLTISFDNGVAWEFDIPMVNKKTAEGVSRVLSAR
jgi:hypothetical protein